jgi:hypothetical protein
VSEEVEGDPAEQAEQPQLRAMGDAEFDAWLEANPEAAPEPVAEPFVANKYERMSLSDIDRIAREATGEEKPEALPGSFGDMSDEDFVKVLDEMKTAPELIDWDAKDLSPAQELARQHIELREAGVDGALAQRVLDGEVTLQEAVIQREADVEAARLINAQPAGLTESLSDAEFEDLLRATKEGWGEDAARRLAREKGLAH